MRKRLVPLFMAAAVLAAPIAASAESFEVPVKPEDYDKVADMLLKDNDFSRRFMQKFAHTKMGGLQATLRANEETARMLGAANMQEGPAGGMEEQRKDDASQGKTPVNMDNLPASGMASGNGMQGAPAKTAATPSTERMFADSPVPEAGDAKLADSRGWPVKAPKNAGVDPVPLKADRVDIFMSLTCPYCAELWKNLRANQISGNHLLEDRVNLWVLPRSNSEAGVAIIYQLAYAKSPQTGYEFLDYFFNNKDRYAGMREGEVFADFNQWMLDHGMTSILDVRNDPAALKEITRQIEGGLQLGREFQIQAFPSIYVDGKLDDNWFSKVMEASTKGK